MKIFKAIAMSSLFIPLLVFVLYVTGGFILLVSELISYGKYDNGWIGFIYAGAMYSYFSALVSSVPTFILGLPSYLIAKKYNVLSKKLILVGAIALGGLYLSIASTVFFNVETLQGFLWLALAGSLGGLVNGLVFLKYIK